MSSFEVTGTIYKKFDTQRVSDRFQKREFVIEKEDGAYPQLILFQLVQDRCDVIDKYNEGDAVTVTFNLRGREWVNPEGVAKYFTNLAAWKVDAATTANTNTPPPPATDDFPTANDAPAEASNEDLPF